jgi:hypothetical protein
VARRGGTCRPWRSAQAVAAPNGKTPRGALRGEGVLRMATWEADARTRDRVNTVDVPAAPRARSLVRRWPRAQRGARRLELRRIGASRRCVGNAENRRAASQGSPNTGLLSRSAAPPPQLASLRRRGADVVLGWLWPPAFGSAACLVAPALFSAARYPRLPLLTMCPSKPGRWRHNAVYRTPADARILVIGRARGSRAPRGTRRGESATQGNRGPRERCPSFRRCVVRICQSNPS